MKDTISKLIIKTIAPFMRVNLTVVVNIRGSLEIFVYKNSNRSRILTALVNSLDDVDCLLNYAKKSNRKVILNIFESLINGELRKTTFNRVIQITKDTDSDVAYKVLSAFESGINCRCVVGGWNE